MDEDEAGQPTGPDDRAARVAAALRAVPRERFLPASMRPYADADEPLPLGAGSTCSQPTTVRQMLELLDVRPGHRVLDVGSGSGWTTALLAWLASPGGRVVGVELLAPLVHRSSRTIAEMWPQGAIGGPDARYRVEQARPDVLGWPDGGPYDRILVSADARSRVPPELLKQMGPDAVLVGPVDGVMTRVRQRDGHRQVTHHGLYDFVPLRGYPGDSGA